MPRKRAKFIDPILETARNKAKMDMDKVSEPILESLLKMGFNKFISLKAIRYIGNEGLDNHLYGIFACASDFQESYTRHLHITRISLSKNNQ